MNILHTTPSLALSCGGPPRSVSQICEHLSMDGDQVSILTTVYPNDPIIELSESIRMLSIPGKSKSFWGRLLAANYCKYLGQLSGSDLPNVVHNHGVWLRCSYEVGAFTHKREIPYVLSPRGMLEPWALNHSKWKKKLAWQLYARRSCEFASSFHATAESEAESIRRLGFKQPIAVIPNGVQLPRFDPSSVFRPSSSEKRTALFLSRINPKKGLPMLLDAWKRLSPEGWRLIIAGNDDSNHLPVVRQKIAEFGLGGQVEIAGPLFGEAKEAAYRDADLFVLPSYSENFGIVVAEALGYGLPVLTTTGCPWQELVSERCGWWVDPTTDRIELGLKAALSTEPGELKAMGLRGRALVEKNYQWPYIAERMLEFYDWLINGGRQPDFVV